VFPSPWREHGLVLPVGGGIAAQKKYRGGGTLISPWREDRPYFVTGKEKGGRPELTPPGPKVSSVRKTAP